jgi:hypothetical protein
MTPKDFYSKYESKRGDFLDRAETNAKFTLPYVVRSDSATGSDGYEDEYGQSFGGRAVNSLKAKIGMSLMPPSTSSFRFEPTEDELDALVGQILAQQPLEQQDAEGARAQVYTKISMAVDRVNKEINSQSIRGTLFDIIQQLLIVGAVIVEKLPKKGVTYHPLTSSTAKLDNNGTAVALCIVEKLLSPPKEFPNLEEKDEYLLYTKLMKHPETNKWTMSQQIDDEVLEDVATYTDDTVPFFYVGWTYLIGDAYSRPFVEDYIEDLKQFSALSNLVTAGSIAAAKTLIFVDGRSGRTRPADITRSRNLDVITGRAEDVSAFQLGKNYDFQMPMQKQNELKRELASAFLMNESATRDAERVTAAEIQLMAQELETTSLAGVYSRLTEGLIKPIIVRVMGEMGITLKDLAVVMVIGLDALGRSQETRNLDAYVQTLNAIGAGNRLKAGELSSRYAGLYGVNMTGLLKTNKELEAEAQAQQQAQQQAMAQQAGAQASGQRAGEAVGDAAAQQMQQAQQS